ncbi:uncharacterized protein B0P05DRAFT_587337 [Gilbertella persicaria]|uniref:uncharacterized protein n=1 Tax=Gilbertella persicaria TaxID=101096 RepID=UPI002220CAA7|nr:uncharacterized protein B0P05DRAFT_587337 [Gilbertella persicaria]KAI8079120.1 hypothetical protein B0P05DRAFT_587337 [Gilbertella persicaria]
MSEDKQKPFVFNKHSDTPDTKPHQHRCNGHLEDALEGLLAFDIIKPFGVFFECQEPPRYKPNQK